MTARRNSNRITPDDVIEVLSRLPVWVGPIAILVAFAILRWVVPWALEDANLEETLKQTKPIEIAHPVMRNGIGGASRMIAPYFAELAFGLWAIAMFVKGATIWKARRATKPLQETPLEPAGEVAPYCPECNSGMQLRRARRGAKAGSKFWGCSKYPECKGTRELTTEKPRR